LRELWWNVIAFEGNKESIAKSSTLNVTNIQQASQREAV